MIASTILGHCLVCTKLVWCSVVGSCKCMDMNCLELCRKLVALMNKHVALERARKNLTASSSLIFQLMQLSDTRASVSIGVKQAAGFLCFLNLSFPCCHCNASVHKAVQLQCTVLVLVKVYNQTTNKQHPKYRAFPDLGLTGWNGKIWRLAKNE